MKLWSAADEWVLRYWYPHVSTEEAAAIAGHTVAQAYRKARQLGLRKSKRYLASPAACRLRRGDQVGAAYRFPKGHVPANKGLRRPGWSAGRMCETQFKKGQLPHTWKPIGSERINADGYRDRKVSDTGYPPRDWKGVHVLLWEEHLGPVLPGHCVCFKNGDKTDIRCDNLALLSRAERMRRNSFRTTYPPELHAVIQLRGVLNRKINRRTRERDAAENAA